VISLGSAAPYQNCKPRGTGYTNRHTRKSVLFLVSRAGNSVSRYFE
jgi:hypothetical protein